MYSYSWPAPRSNWSVVSFLLLDCWQSFLKEAVVEETQWICASWWKSSGAMMFILLFCYCIHPFAKQCMYVLEWDRRSKIILCEWKKIMCSVRYWNQSRNEISMSVILDFMNTAVPNCQGCRRSKGNACWTYILVFQIQLLESSQSLVMILWRSHRLIVHSYIRPETWPLECHQRTNDVLPIK